MASPHRPEIAVVGAGVASAVGTGCGALWAALAEGKDGLRNIERFAVDQFLTNVAGLWPGWDDIRQPASQAAAGAHVLSASKLGITAAREAWTGARLGTETSPSRVAVVLGTCFGEDFLGFSELTESIAAALGARGPRLTLSTACSSSTAAIGLGRDLIEHGFADLVFAGGADVLTREVFAGFHALGALSAGKCTPLGEHYGTTLGEGAGFVVLESAERARRRGVEAWNTSTVLGYGLSGDAFHDTSPDPSGSGIARAIRSALSDAGVEGQDIDYVNLHATGTDSNDVAETAGLRASLGARADRIPASATKSFLGHAQGAAGVLETVASLLCIRQGVVPPTLRCARPRLCAPSDPVAADRPRPHATRRFLKVSAAFGGANAALVMGSAAAPRVAPDRKAVEVIGISAVGPHGASLAALERWMGEGRALTGAVADLEPRLRWDPRGLDPSARYATAAASLALADAGVVVRGALRDRVGLFTGNSRCPARSAFDCRSSIERRGLGGVSPVAFAHMTLNAPAGACAKQLSLRGPLLALSTGRGSGLAALALAAQQLATRGDADLMLAGGLDELPVEPAAGLAEGAAFALLRAMPEPRSATVCVEGWGIAGPDGLLDAVEVALEGRPGVEGVFAALPQAEARLSGSRALGRLRLGVVDVQALAGGAEATASAFAFVLAVAKLRRREAARLLVLSGGDSMWCAVVLALSGAMA